METKRYSNPNQSQTSEREDNGAGDRDRVEVNHEAGNRDPTMDRFLHYGCSGAYSWILACGKRPISFWC